MEQDTLKRLEQEVLRFIPAGEREDARQEAYLAELEGKDPICAAGNGHRKNSMARTRQRSPKYAGAKHPPADAPVAW